MKNGFLFFFGVIFILHSCKSEPAPDLLSSAEVYAEKGDYSKAVKLLDTLIKQDPANIDARLDRGYYNEQLGNNEKAISDYSNILCCIDGRNTAAFYNRALIYSQMNKPLKGLLDLNRAIASKGGEIVWVENGNTSIETNPYDIPMNELRFRRGVLLFEMDSLKVALEDFNYAIQDRYLLEEDYYYRGIIHLSYNNTNYECADLKTASSYGNLDADTLILMYCK